MRNYKSKNINIKVNMIENLIGLVWTLIAAKTNKNEIDNNKKLTNFLLEEDSVEYFNENEIRWALDKLLLEGKEMYWAYEVKTFMSLATDIKNSYDDNYLFRINKLVEIYDRLNYEEAMNSLLDRNREIIEEYLERTKKGGNENGK